MIDDNLYKIDNSENTGNDVKVDGFPKITEFLNGEGMDECRNLIEQVLNDEELKKDKINEKFEEFLDKTSPTKKIKCEKELKNCKTIDDVKSVIFENIGYKIGTIRMSGNVALMVEKRTDTEQARTDTEQARTDTEKARTDTEQARTDTEQARTDTEQARTYTEQVGNFVKMNNDMLKKCSDYREQLLVGHEELDQKIKDEAKNIKDNLNIDDATKQKLEQNGIDENFIDNYILVKVTLNEVKKDSSFDIIKVQEFEGLVGDLDNRLKLSNRDVLLKNIDNACNVPDTKLSSFDKDNIAQTRTELFNKDAGNQDLIEFRDANMESNDYSEVFPKMNDVDLVKMYGKFMPSGAQKYLEEAQKHIDDGTIDNYKQTPNGKKIFEYLENVKMAVDNKTKEFVEEMCILSQLKGMSMCIGQESGNDFNFNKANEIQNDNGVLTLNGHIDGVDFSVRHDTNKPDARLQTNSKLGVSADKNTFTLGSGKQFVDSPFILPSQNEIFKIIVQEVQSDSNDLKKSDNLPNYFKDLQENIMGRMDKVYKDAELAHYYITNKVKGEKVINNSVSLIEGIKPGIDLSNPINQDNNPKIHSFLKIINFNIENSTTGEKDKLNKILSRIEEIKNNYRNNNGKEAVDTMKYPPIIENYLKNETRLQDGNEDSKFGLISDLFTYYSEHSRDQRSSLEGAEGAASKMVIDDLYRDLFEFLSSGESEVAQNWKKNKKNEEIKKQHEEEEKQDKATAPDILDLDNTEIWPE